MKTFQHQLWGYEIDLPREWHHRKFGDKDGFALDPDAFQPAYQGDYLAQLLIQGEWNSLNKSIRSLWNQHLGRTTLFLGAKKVGAAPWRMAGARGYEVEIALPQKSRRRLWAGILEKGALVLEFAVLHWKDHRELMEPILSRMISSLRLIPRAEGVEITPEGLPLPAGTAELPPGEVIDEITDPKNWSAHSGEFSVGALQAFYIRELKAHSWSLLSYTPYPGQGNPPFARFKISKEQQQYTLGLLPDAPDQGTAAVVLRKTRALTS